MISLLRRKLPVRTLGYHPMTDDWRFVPWDCTDPGPLTLAEATNVWSTHNGCGSGCVISATARKVLKKNGGHRK